MRILLDDGDIRDALSPLARFQRTAFGLMVCDRMMRSLEHFARDTGFDAGLYRQAMAEGWRFLEQGRPEADFELLANQCLDRAPHAVGAGHVLKSAALDAAQAVGDVMAYIHGHDDEVLVEIIDLTIDTVSVYLAGTDAAPAGAFGAKHRLAHALTQAELRRQAADLAFLALLPAHQRFDNTGQIRRRAARAANMLPLDGA